MTSDAEDDCRGTIEYDEFLMLMTHKILKMTSDAEDDGRGDQDQPVDHLKYAIVPIGRNRVDHRELGFDPLGP